MPERISSISITINGTPQQVAAGTTVAAAMMLANQPARISITGQPRYPLCGMGICYECRATIDGVAHQRTCQLPCRPGMRVETSA